MDDLTVYENDPDLIVLQTIDAYAKGQANREDVAAAMLLALERPLAEWRPEIRHRYAAMIIWETRPQELDAMLERALSWGTTVKPPGGVQ